MKNRRILVGIVFGALVVLSAFNTVKFAKPKYFPEPVYNFTLNPISLDKIELGRKLFYDPILSKDSSISCASCHSPFNAFAHTDHDLSHGIHDSIGTRNAPSLVNLAWQKSFMWDGAINHLDVQALAPISHPGEMADDIKNVAHKLSRHQVYTKAFSNIYTDNKITGERILKVMAQFQLSLVSSNSKYDSVRRRQSSFSNQELHGYALFATHCNTCHVEPLFSSYEFANNGLAIDPTLNDYGRYKVTKKSSDSLLFKIPTLRNLKYSYPYMHDGRFDKLRDVLNHYDHGIVTSETISPILKEGISLSSKQKTDLIAFLLTLNDKEFVFNKKHSFPSIR